MECLFLISLELNIFALIYVVTKKLINAYRHKEQLPTDVALFACEKQSKSLCLKRKEHVVARGIVNSLCSTILFSLSMDILSSTEFINRPYIGVTRRAEFGICSLVSLSIFNLLLKITTGRMRKGKIHCICKHIVAACTLLTTLCFDENSLTGVLGLIMMGSVFIDELKVIFQMYQKNENRLYNMFSLLHLAVNFLCQFFLPVIFIAVATVRSTQRFFDIHPLTQTMFFLSTTFFFWHNVWWLRKITYSYMAERAKLYIIRTIQAPEPTNFSIVTKWGNKSFRTTLEKRVQDKETTSEEYRDGVKWTGVSMTF